jgi:folate-binding protein YgfZ
MADGTSPLLELDAQYRAMREEAALVRRPSPFVIDVTGPEAAEYLQGQLTNDVEALRPGDGRYAALLDRKGHIQADMRILAAGGGDLIVVAEAEAGPALLRHLSMYKVGRDVDVAERDATELLSLIGPRSSELAAAEALVDEHEHAEVSLGGAPALAVRTDAGVDLLVPGASAEAVATALLEAGAEEAAEDAAEIVRVESGRPRFGREMSPATMPAEAGIVERAVDFDKGCYIGQEPVARLHYRGRPNRTLRGLRLDAPADKGASLRLGDREVGEIGTACVSPSLGPIALAVVRREAEPGTRIDVEGSGGAEVIALPFGD